MKTVKKVIDINAHVQNITCQVFVCAENPIATIGFDNLGFGTVTAIKFNAKGYNSFGDVVQINGKETFFLIIQDISIERNAQARDLKVNLPNTNIRKLELVEAQICYSDGSVVSYEGEDLREFELEEYNVNGAERDISNALKDKFGSGFKYKPVEYAEGWICGCGRFNKSGTICSGCKCSKAAVFKYTLESETSKLVGEFKEAEEKRVEASRQEAIRKEKEEKKKKIYIGIGTVIALIIAYFIINVSIMAGRTTYSSEAEMKSAVAGTYTYYDGYKAKNQLKISGNTMIKRWVSLGSDFDMDLSIKSWNPSKGTFEVSIGTITVTNTGDLKYDGNIYEKGGSWSSSSSSSLYSSSYTRESGSAVLKIQDVKVTSNGSYTICTGTVKNTGSKTYKFVEVKGAFKDSSGNVVDTDWTYAAGSEGLEPNESTTFRLSVTGNSKITDCSVSLLDYD